MKSLLRVILAFVAFGTGGHVLAADMPVKAPPRVAAAVYSWTGFYIGGGVGYGMFNLRTSLTDNGVLRSDNQTWAGRGWLATVVGGYDHQFSDRIVAGVFADADFSDIRGHLGDVYWEATGRISQRWAWAAGGRVGYVILPGVLSYVNAGYTQAHFSRASLFAFGLANPNGDFVPAQTYDGWFLGGGVDIMVLPGWSAKTEYRLADYGRRSVPIIFNTGAPTLGVDRIHPVVQTVRTDLVYRFGTPANAIGTSAAALPAPIQNWTALYLGAGFGYGMFNLDTSLTRNGVLESDNQTFGGRGWFGTVLVGFDYQLNDRFVVGAFADWDFSDIRGHLGDTWWEGAGRISQRRAWAAGGRVGYTVRSVLPYVNAGYTQARFSSVNLLNFGLAGNPVTGTVPAQTYGGWFVGGGVETPLFPGWTVKTEYRYADYGTKHVMIIDNGFVGGTNILRIDPVVQTVRTDLVYRFNWGPAPVAARY